MENALAGVSVLEAKGIKTESIALPLLGGGSQRVEPAALIGPVLRAAQSALERSTWLSRVMFIELGKPNEGNRPNGTSAGSSPEKKNEPTPVSDWLVDSRGGTRTHDPGIMSAVL